MSETVNLELIGTLLRAIQAEQRSLRDENGFIRFELGRLAGQMVTRDLLSEVVRVLAARIGNFEALIETRLDHFQTTVEGRLDRVERRLEGVESRLDKMEGAMTAGFNVMDARFEALSAQIAALAGAIKPPA